MARKPKIRFEEALQKVEGIVEQLESGELRLDDSLAKYEEAVAAIKECYQILQDAEKRIETLVKGEDGEMTVQPFTSPDESAADSDQEG